MKGISTVTLVLCILLVLSACANMNNLNIEFNEAALKADAEAVSNALITGDYDAVTPKFDATMKKAVSLKALEDGWVQTVSGIGDYVSRYSVEGTRESGYYNVTVIEQFQSSGVRVRVVYSAEGLIAGLQCAPVELNAPVMSEGIKEEAVTVTADERYPLSGSLTLPKGIAKPPVVILVQGSGSSDKNESIYGNKPFFDIAQGLAEHGVATLRYDKRYFAYPEAGVALGADVTLRDEVLDDLYAAIKLMQNDERVDSNRIFVLGHSLGGMLTPVIAAENPSLAGVISMAGSLRPLWEISYDQNQDAIAGIDVSTLSETDKATLESQIKQVEADIAVLRGDFAELSSDTTLLGIPVGYWRSLDELCGMKYLDSVTMPMLILQGGADFQVYPDKDFTLWQDALSNRDNVSFHLYEGLNHIMMPTQGKRDLSEYTAIQTVDARVISDIAMFVNANR